MFSGMKLYNPSERKVVVQNTIRMTSTALSSGDPKSSCARGVEAFMHGTIFHLFAAKKIET